MEDITYTTTFFSDWHIGSGLSSGSKNDALVKKNKYGLPVIPGRTMKGLLKDAAADLFEGDEDYSDFIKDCFEPDTENGSSENKIYYGNATFTKELTTFFLENSNENKKEKLYRLSPSIRIDDQTSVAKNKSLRTIETCIPLTLVSTIFNVPEKFKDKMTACLKMVKHIGSVRNRGLGRCEIYIIEAEKGGKP